MLSKFSPCRHVSDRRLDFPSDGAGKGVNGQMVVYAVQIATQQIQGQRTGDVDDGQIC